VINHCVSACQEEELLSIDGRRNSLPFLSVFAN